MLHYAIGDAGIGPEGLGAARFATGLAEVVDDEQTVRRMVLWNPVEVGPVTNMPSAAELAFIVLKNFTVSLLAHHILSGIDG